jgi:autotransporter-associated beta strand protein
VGAAQFQWSGASLTDMLWSNGANWTGGAVPIQNTDDPLFDGGAGYTNAPGVVNNVLDSSAIYSSMSMVAVANSTTAKYHTTLLNPGVTLWLTNAAVTTSPAYWRNFFQAGADGATNDQIYATIRGPGASVIAGDPNAPNTNNYLLVVVRSLRDPVGTHMATLDMSGLDNFRFAGGGVSVGSSSTGANGKDWPRGRLILAKTNVLVSLRPWLPGSSAATEFCPFMVGVHAPKIANGGNGSEGFVQLGQQNEIYSSLIKLGGTRLGSGTMNFQSGLSNPTLKARGTNGVDRLDIRLGDSSNATVDAAADRTASGILDLTGGTVDLMVSNMVVGCNFIGIVPTDRGGGYGLLSFTGGKIDVTTMSIGSQSGNDAGDAIGVVNVLSNAVLVVQDLNMGGDMGASGAGIGSGTVNISYGGQVIVSNNIVENDGGDGNGFSTIYLGPSSVLNMINRGTIGADSINLDGGQLLNAGTLSSTTTLGGSGTVTSASPLTLNGVLSPGTLYTPGTITHSGNIIFGGNSVVVFSLTNATTVGGLVNDYVAVTGNLTPSGSRLAIVPVAPLALGTYRLMDYTGTKSGSFTYLNDVRNAVLDQSTPHQVNLTVNGSTTASLIWAGTSGNWDLGTSLSWNGGSEKFYQTDTVTFDDSSSQTTVNLTGTLYPGSLAVNSTKAYAFTGSGQIAGLTGLTKSGSGTLTVGTVNSFTGPVSVVGGALVVNGELGSGAVTVNSGATLGGAGLIAGPVTVQSQGILSPGASVGMLTIKNNLTLSAGTTNVFEINGDTLAHDMVAGLSNVTYGGTLVLNVSGSGSALLSGATVQLFSARTYAGAFTSIVEPSPTPGRGWDTSSLAVNGTIKVIYTGSLNVLQAPQPASKSVGDSATFTAVFTNLATYVQWYKDGNPIPGATSFSILAAGPLAPRTTSSYQIPFVLAGTSAGSYSCQATNAVNSSTTSAALMTVLTDVVKPTVSSASASIWAKRVRLHFSEPVDPSSVTDPANYVFQGGALSVVSATVSSTASDIWTLDVGTDPAPAAGANYVLLVSNARDTTGNTILANTPVPVHVVSGFPVISNLIAAFDGTSIAASPVDGVVWNDLSGNENHALNPNPAANRRPSLKANGLGGIDTILFDQAFQQYLQIDGTNGTGLADNSHTWFFVVKPTSFGSTPNVLRHWSSFNNANWGSFFADNNAKSGFQPALFANGRNISAAAIETPAYPVQAGQWVLGEGMANDVGDGTSIVYSRAEYPLSNLVLSGTTNFSSTLAVGSPYLTYVGNGAGLTGGFNGEMEAVLLYYGALDDTQRAAVESYLRSKYFAGISLLVSGANIQVSYVGVLQSSTNVASGYTDVPGNPANPYIITPGNQLQRQFFRARTP